MTDNSQHEKLTIDAGGLEKRIQDAEKRLENILKSCNLSEPIQKIFFIGNSNAGKTTLVNSLMTDNIIVNLCWGENNAELINKKNIVEGNDETKAKGKIGTKKFSETTDPNIWIMNGFMFIDCPGFGDTKGIEQEIYNMFLIDYALSYKQQSSEIKIVMVASEQEEGASNGDLIADVFETIKKLFPNLGPRNENVGLVFTKVTSQSNGQNLLYRFRPERSVSGIKLDFYNFFASQQPTEKLSDKEVNQYFKNLQQQGKGQVFAFPKPEFKEDLDKQPYDFPDKQSLKNFIQRNFIKTQHKLTLSPNATVQLQLIWNNQFAKLKSMLMKYYDNYINMFDNIDESNEKNADDTDEWIQQLIELRNSHDPLESMQQFKEYMDPLLEKHKMSKIQLGAEQQSGKSLLNFIKKFGLVGQSLSDIETDFIDFLNKCLKILINKKNLYLTNKLLHHKNLLLHGLTQIQQQIIQHLRQYKNSQGANQWKEIADHLKREDPETFSQLVESFNRMNYQEKKIKFEDIYAESEEFFDTFEQKLQIKGFNRLCDDENKKIKKANKEIEQQLSKIQKQFNNQINGIEQQLNDLKTKEKNRTISDEEAMQLQKYRDQRDDIVQKYLYDKDMLEIKLDLIDTKIHENDRQKDKLNELLQQRNNSINEIKQQIQQFIISLNKEGQEQFDFNQQLKKYIQMIKQYFDQFRQQMIDKEKLSELIDFNKDITDLNNAFQRQRLQFKLSNLVDNYNTIKQKKGDTDRLTYNDITAQLDQFFINYEVKKLNDPKKYFNNEYITTIANTFKDSFTNLLNAIDRKIKQLTHMRDNDWECNYRQVDYIWIDYKPASYFETYVRFYKKVRFYQKLDKDSTKWIYIRSYGWEYIQKYDQYYRRGRKETKFTSYKCLGKHIPPLDWPEREKYPDFAPIGIDYYLEGDIVKGGRDSELVDWGQRVYDKET